MRTARFGLLFIPLLLSVPIWGQQAASPQQISPPQAIRDPQAVNVLNQALSVAGGVPAVEAISDYTATGTVTYHSGTVDVSNPVTISARGLNQLRMDSALPKGTRSISIDKGNTSQKAEDGGVLSGSELAPLSPGSFAFPHLLLAAALRIQLMNLSYKGTVEIDGHSAYDVHISPSLPAKMDPQGTIGEFKAVDLFIDASTYQILMMCDMIRTIKNISYGHLHETRFSNYQNTNGVLIPFSISQTIGGQQSSVIVLTAVSFNSGLTDSSFELSGTAH